MAVGGNPNPDNENDTESLENRFLPMAIISATVSIVCNINDPQLFITLVHSGNFDGITGGALSSGNLVFCGLSPILQKNLHFGSAP